MAQSLVIRIDPNGDARFLVSESSKGFLDGGAIIRRASHVEPKRQVLRWAFHTLRWMFGEDGRVGNWSRRWPVLWRVNLAPVSGPVLPEVFKDRQVAIDREVLWLTENWLRA